MEEKQGGYIPKSHSDLDAETLQWILDHIFGNIFVTDGAGNIVFVNQQSVRVLKTPKEELLKMHASDNLKRGNMSRSTTLEAIEQKKVVMGGFTTGAGVEYLSTSTPLLDEHGAVQLVMTFSQDKTAMNALSDAVAREHKNAENYKQALNYIQNKGEPQTLISASPLMQEVVQLAGHLAKSDSTLLIYGESGTGKEVIANYIQANSHRRDEPFICVNCAAIPPNLMESEFFGYAKGAFTGASREGKPGVFEIANHGILFLDEVGELPIELQGKLLRVLETSGFYRIGGTKPIQTDVRLIAATNQNLRSMVENKLFREDLYYRLNVIPIKIPALRERREDIAPLAKLFLQGCNRKYALNHHFSPEVLHLLEHYGWPGNVREVRNIVERMALTTMEDTIEAAAIIQNPIFRESGLLDPLLSGVQNGIETLEAVLPRIDHVEPLSQGGGRTVGDTFQDMQRQRVLDAMLATNGNKVKAAQHLGISAGKLYRLLREMH